MIFSSPRKFAALLAALAVAAHSTAQSPSSRTAATSDDVVRFDKFTVAAARPPLYDARDANFGAFGSRDVTDVPLSISTYSSTLIENLRARTLMDVVKLDPSVQNAAIGGAYNHFALRGFAADWTDTMRREGLSVAPFQDVPLENVEHIDVLKGPSGFLYGFNSPGGTINYLIKRPSAAAFSSVTIEGRNGAGYYGHLDAGGPLGAAKALGYRINLAGEQVGDFTHARDLRRKFASAMLEWQPRPGTLVRFDGDFQDKKLAAQPIIGLTRAGTLPPLVDPDTLLGQPWLQYETRAWNLGARIDHSLGADWTLTAQINYSVNHRTSAFPDIYEVTDSGDIVRGDIYYAPGHSFEPIAGQIFANGKFSTLGVNHELVAGVSDRRYEAFAGGNVILPITVGNLFRPVYSARPTLPASVAKNHTYNRQPSAFVSDFIRFNDAWQLVLGARHIRYQNRFWNAAGTLVTDYRKTATVPSAGVIYRMVPAVSLYASYSQGLQPGAIAPFNTVNAGEHLNPLLSHQVEIGAKTVWREQLTLTAALFEIEKALEYVNGANRYVQDGRQRHRGIEAQASGALTPDLSIIASAAWLAAEQRNTGDAATSGRRTPNVPRWQGSLTFDYRVPVLRALSVSASGYYVGDRAVNARNTVFLPGYTRFDFGARYRTQFAGRPVIFRAQIENAFDRRYWAAANFGSAMPGAGRVASLAVTTEF